MTLEFQPWLDLLEKNNKGGWGLKPIDRGTEYSFTLSFEKDLTGYAFEGSINTGPDSGGTAIADFVITVGAFGGGSTPVTISVPLADVNAIPADNDNDGVVTFAWDILATAPEGGTKQRILGGYIPVLGAVTDAA